jgi:hypothetical protein
MSFAKKLIAAGSIFAMAAALAPTAFAATGVTITGYSTSNPSFSLCLYGPNGTQSSAQIVSGSGTSINASLPVQPLPNGSTYNLFVQNASGSCTNGTIAGAIVSFIVYPGHMTTVPVSFTSNLLAANGTPVVVNQAPYYSSNNGNTTINLCLGSTTPVTVEFTDAENDNLTGNVSNTPISSSYISGNGKVTYTVYPTSNNTASLGTSTTQTFSVTEQSGQVPTTLTGTATINFVTVNCGGGNVVPGTVVSSSSSSSTSSSSSVAATASSVAAASSVATTTVPAASGPKGESLRTGGF